MSGTFYVWLILLLISYPVAYKYYRQQRMLSKNVAEKTVRTSAWKVLKGELKNKYIYGVGCFIVASEHLIESLNLSEWLNLLILFAWLYLTARFWKRLIG